MYEYRIVSNGELFIIQGRDKIWVFCTPWEDCREFINRTGETVWFYPNVENAQAAVERHIRARVKKEKWKEV